MVFRSVAVVRLPLLTNVFNHQVNKRMNQGEDALILRVEALMARVKAELLAALTAPDGGQET